MNKKIVLTGVVLFTLLAIFLLFVLYGTSKKNSGDLQAPNNNMLAWPTKVVSTALIQVTYPQNFEESRGTDQLGFPVVSLKDTSGNTIDFREVEQAPVESLYKPFVGLGYKKQVFIGARSQLDGYKGSIPTDPRIHEVVIFKTQNGKTVRALLMYTKEENAALENEFIRIVENASW